MKAVPLSTIINNTLNMLLSPRLYDNGDNPNYNILNEMQSLLVYIYGYMCYMTAGIVPIAVLWLLM